MDQAMRWRKSTRCDSSSCAEVAEGSTGVWMRNNRRLGVVLSIAHADWAALVTDMKTGRLDRPGIGG